MTRKNDNSELFSHVSVFGMMTDSTAPQISTTLATTMAEAGLVMVPTSSPASTALEGLYGRIGYLGGGNMEIFKVEGSATADLFTLVSGVAYTHAALEPVVEVERTDLGGISDDGVSVEVIADKSRVDAATQIGTLTHHTVHTAYNCSVALEMLSEENLLTSMGIADSAVTGAGSTADPHIAHWKPASIDSINPIHFYATGTLKSGDNIEIQFWDCRLDPAKTMAFARGKDTPAGFSFSPMHIRFIVPVA